MNIEGSTRPTILWSAVCRGTTVLAEATVEDYPWDESLRQCSTLLLKKGATPGWEFVTLNSTRIRMPMDHPHNPKLKGMKFHVYEHDATGLIRWSVAAVYDPNAVDTPQVQSFIEKIVTITEVLRESNPLWKTGSTLSAQNTFAPILRQRMSEVVYQGKLCELNEQIDSLRLIMARNIELILARGESIEDLQKESEMLSQMASVFKKRSTQLKRKMLWQNAKHGLVMGTAISAGVAIVVVPPLVVAL